MHSLRTLDDADVAGKRVLLRVDLNVPVEDGKVSDTTRIDRILPTIREISQKGGKVILLSHFGRPQGRDLKASLGLVAAAVATGLGRRIHFCGECIGDDAKHAVSLLDNGEVLILENTRFHPEEEANDPAFVKALAAHGDIFVNDAFATSHRAHASIEGLGLVLPAYAGRTMQAEIEALHSALEQPERPVVAVVGGAKVSSKLPVLRHLVSRVDTLVIGGAMAATFLMARGIGIGQSLVEPDLRESAREIMELARAGDCAVVLPVDVVCAGKLEKNAATVTCSATRVPEDQMILDIGPASAKILANVLSSSRTLLWNGPLGAFEIAPFGRGTAAVAQWAAELTRLRRLKSIAGGGDTVAALNAAGVTDHFTYVSTAGGAFLEWIEGRSLPGVAVLVR